MTTIRHTILATGAALLILFNLPANADSKGSAIAAATDKQYLEECGACHYAYPPGLLPARSWEKIMSNLGDHFGENAELGTDVMQSLNTYLAKNAADKVSNRLSASIAKSTADSTPLRITETAFFKREHREISPRLVKDNPQVKSFSRCQACHTRAQEGSFDEDEVNIPGHGKVD